MGILRIARPTNWEDIYNRRRGKDITAKIAMQLLGVKRTTFYNLIKKYEFDVLYK